MYTRTPINTSPSPLSRLLQTELDSQQRTIEEVRAITRKMQHHNQILNGVRSQMLTGSELSQRDQMKIQDAMNEQGKLMQMLIDLMKTLHNTLQNIINNMK